MYESGLIGAMFGLDPVLVAAEPDRFARAWRVAAHNAVVAERNRQRQEVTPAPPVEQE